MNQKVIRWIDRYAGYPICLVLTLARGCLDLFAKKGRIENGFSKVLFVKLTEQGSLVLAYPAFKKAIDRVGADNVYFMVFKENREILDIFNIVDPSNIFEVDSQNILAFIVSVFKNLGLMRRHKIDSIIDMEFFSRASAIISYLSGAKKRVGLHLFTEEGPSRGDLFTHKLIYNPYLHTRIFFLTLVEALDHKPSPKMPLSFPAPKGDENYPVFSALEDEKQQLIQRIEKLKGSPVSKPVILLNPSISDLIPIRSWPEDNFVELGQMISREFPGATIIITGTSKEKKKGVYLAGRIQGAISFVGETSLRELMVLYCIADCLVTNDSGPAHFSYLTPVRSIILFGPETPVLYAHEKEKEKVLASDLVCSPCVNVYNHRNSSCTTRLCLKNIKVEDVFSKVKDIL